MTVIGFRRLEVISGVATGLLALFGPSSLSVTFSAAGNVLNINARAFRIGT